MGWDRKAGGKRYYYRSIRTPDKPHPVKVYMGRGAAGQEAAAAVERRRRDREQATATIQTEQDATAEADLLAEELQDRAAALSELWLLMSGLHYHRGEWRLKRGKDS
jgi:hypothetical protein